MVTTATPLQIERGLRYREKWRFIESDELEFPAQDLLPGGHADSGFLGFSPHAGVGPQTSFGKILAEK